MERAASAVGCQVHPQLSLKSSAICALHYNWKSRTSCNACPLQPECHRPCQQLTEQSLGEWRARVNHQAEEAGMSLQDQGFRFCLSPDKQQARWLHPNEKAQLHPDWIDVTDLSADALAALITPKPLPHGTAECDAAQLDIFNDSGTAEHDQPVTHRSASP